MNMTNEGLARKAAALCKDVINLRGDFLGSRHRLHKKGNMSVEVSGDISAPSVTAYSYEAILYHMYLNRTSGVYEILTNSEIYSSTTRQHMSLYMEALSDVADTYDIKLFEVELGDSYPNGVRNRLDPQVIREVNCRLEGAMKYVYSSARSGTRLVTVVSSVCEARREVARLLDILTVSIPKSVLSDPEWADAIKRAGVKASLLHNLENNTETKHLKTAINGIKALEGRQEGSPLVTSMLITSVTAFV